MDRPCPHYEVKSSVHLREATPEGEPRWTCAWCGTEFRPVDKPAQPAAAAAG